MKSKPEITTLLITTPNSNILTTLTGNFPYNENNSTWETALNIGKTPDDENVDVSQAFTNYITNNDDPIIIIARTHPQTENVNETNDTIASGLLYDTHTVDDEFNITVRSSENIERENTEVRKEISRLKSI